MRDEAPEEEEAQPEGEREADFAHAGEAGDGLEAGVVVDFGGAADEELDEVEDGGDEGDEYGHVEAEKQAGVAGWE